MTNVPSPTPPSGAAEATRHLLAALPAGLAARPVDPKRGLPIPLMNMRPADPYDIDGECDTADFTAIWAPTVIRCGRMRLCGICGNDLGYRFAFIGGPKSAAARSYNDPAFCLDCADAAMTLCPHIAIGHHQRAPEHRMAAETTTPAGFDADRTDEWVMGITRDYKMTPTRGGIIFKAAPFVSTRRFAYVNRTLTEVNL